MTWGWLRALDLPHQAVLTRPYQIFYITRVVITVLPIINNHHPSIVSSFASNCYDQWHSIWLLSSKQHNYCSTSAFLTGTVNQPLYRSSLAHRPWWSTVHPRFPMDRSSLRGPVWGTCQWRWSRPDAQALRKSGTFALKRTWLNLSRFMVRFHCSYYSMFDMLNMCCYVELLLSLSLLFLKAILKVLSFLLFLDIVLVISLVVLRFLWHFSNIGIANRNSPKNGGAHECPSLGDGTRLVRPLVFLVGVDCSGKPAQLTYILGMLQQTCTVGQDNPMAKAYT